MSLHKTNQFNAVCWSIIYNLFLCYVNENIRKCAVNTFLNFFSSCVQSWALYFHDICSYISRISNGFGCINNYKITIG